MEILRRLNWAAEGYAERKFRLKKKENISTEENIK